MNDNGVSNNQERSFRRGCRRGSKAHRDPPLNLKEAQNAEGNMIKWSFDDMSEFIYNQIDKIWLDKLICNQSFCGGLTNEGFNCDQPSILSKLGGKSYLKCSYDHDGLWRSNRKLNKYIWSIAHIIWWDDCLMNHLEASSVNACVKLIVVVVDLIGETAAATGLNENGHWGIERDSVQHCL